MDPTGVRGMGANVAGADVVCIGVTGKGETDIYAAGIGAIGLSVADADEVHPAGACAPVACIGVTGAGVTGSGVIGSGVASVGAAGAGGTGAGDTSSGAACICVPSAVVVVVRDGNASIACGAGATWLVDTARPALVALDAGATHAVATEDIGGSSVTAHPANPEHASASSIEYRMEQFLRFFWCV